MKKRLDPREIYSESPEKTDELKKIAELYDKNEKKMRKNYDKEQESCQNMLEFHGHRYLHGINAYWCHMFSIQGRALENEQRKLEQLAEAISNGTSTVKM